MHWVGGTIMGIEMTLVNVNGIEHTVFLSIPAIEQLRDTLDGVTFYARAGTGDY
jgi:hypothetical protein